MNDESRIDRILGDWRARRDAGEPVAPEDVIAAHPDVAAALRTRFDAIAAAKRPSLRDVPPERYADFRVLGAGGMGIVYWALDTDLNRQVAFKVVRPDAGQSAEGSGAPAPAAPLHLAPPAKDTPSSHAFATLKARFLQEAWVTAGLEHPGIVPVYEVGQTNEGVPYYTMRFVKGSRTLTAAIDETKGRPIEERLTLLEPFLKVCDAIRYAHAHGVIHRDLKPDNVALGEFGEAVVLDWGLAKFTGRADVAGDAWRVRLDEYRAAADLKTMASAMGTPGYMSPEAALGRVDEVDVKSDVYSLGAILFQILTGRLPYEFRTYGELAMKLMKEDAPAASQTVADVPPEISRICASALARDRAARTPTADALASDVRTWLREREREAQRAALLHEAETARAGIEATRGEETLRRVDHLQAVCARLLAAHPESVRGAELSQEADALQERAIVERERAARARVGKRAAFVGLGAALVGATAFAWVVHAEKRETERALVAARDERDAKLAALDEAQRLRAGAEAERDAKTAALRRTRVTGLTAAAVAAVDRWPMRALLLAREAVRLDPGPPQTDALRRALFENLELSLRTYDFQFNCADVSPDGARAVLGLWSSVAIVVGADGKTVATLHGHAKPVLSTAFSADGTRIVTASADGSARVWDLAGRQLALLRGHDGPVNSAAFSPDGSRVVTASDDRTARIWDLEGRELVVLRGHEDGVTSAAFSPDGSRVVTASQDHSARIFDVAGKEIAKLSGHTNPVVSAVFSPDGSRIATAAYDKTARIWDASGKELAVLRGHEHWLRSARFSPDGLRVVTSSIDKTARVWRLDGTELVVLRGHEGQVRSAQFVRDGTQVFTTSMDRTTRVWSLDRREVATIDCGRPVRAAGVSPDGALVVAAGEGGVPVLADADGVARGTLGTAKAGVRSVAFARDGRIAVTGTGAGMRVFAPDGRMLAAHAGHEAAVFSVAFSPDGSRLVTASGDKTARVWGAAGEAPVLLLGHEGRVLTAAFSPDGASVVTASADGTARLFGIDGKPGPVLRGHGAQVSAACFSPDGTRVLTTGVDRTARVWDLAGKELLVLRGHGAAVIAGVWSADGARILTGAADDTARLWSADGKELAVLRGHEGKVGAVSFSADGRSVLTASDDGTARIWDLAGRELAVLRGHQGWVNVAVFFPDGSRVLTASDDGTARIWFVRVEDLVKLADARVDRGFTDEERREYADLLDAK